MKTDPFFENEVTDYLAEFTSDGRILDLLRHCAGRVLLRRPPDSFKVSKFAMMLVVEWLSSAVADRAPWLEKVDDYGRPRKLMKFSKFEDIVREAKRAKAVDEQKRASIVLDEGEEVLFDIVDGDFHLVELRTAKAMDREGGVLQNCLGDGLYDKAVAEGNWRFLVLRDRRSKSHVAMEVHLEAGLVFQMRGKQNRGPGLRYMKPLGKYFAEKGWDLNQEWKSEWLIDARGNVHATDWLPRDLELRGSLDIRGCPHVCLPDTMRISGGLEIVRSTIARPADKLEVRGYLSVEDTEGERLAASLNVGTHFSFLNSRLPEIALVMATGETFLIRDTGDHVVRMPRFLRVGDWLDVRQTAVEKFGEDTGVEGPITTEGSAVAYTFAVDANRHILLPGDIVRIAKVMRTPDRRYDHLLGAWACVEHVVGQDGCGLMVADERDGSIVYMTSVASSLVWTDFDERHPRSGAVLVERDDRIEVDVLHSLEEPERGDFGLLGDGLLRAAFV